MWMSKLRKWAFMKSLVSSLSVAAMALAAAVVPAQAGASTEGPMAGGDALQWASCGIDAYPSLECAKLRVPLDRSDPDGRTIALTISRAAATGGGKARRTLLVNPGGPGGSGVAFAGQVAAALDPEVRRTYDVIGFDPRGSFRSEPSMSCQPEYFKGPRPDFKVRNAAEVQDWLDRTSSYSAACGEAYGEYLPHMRSEDTVADMERIRTALGVDKVAYYGFSYGTFLGAVYATLHPESLDRLVLDGVLGPEGLDYGQQFRQDRGFEEGLQAFFRWVARHDDVYGLGDTPDAVREQFYGLRSRIAEHPALDGTFGPSEFDVTYQGTSREADAWPDLARAVADTLHSGDQQVLQEVFAKFGPPQTSDAFYAPLNAVRCTDNQWPRDARTYLRDAARSNRTAPFASWNNMWFSATCMSWPVPGGPAPKVEARPGAPEALMLNADHDPATPLDRARAMHEVLPSRLVTETGSWRHGVALKHHESCVDDLLNAYLATGELPDRDVSCPAEPLPTP